MRIQRIKLILLFIILTKVFNSCTNTENNKLEVLGLTPNLTIEKIIDFGCEIEASDLGLRYVKDTLNATFVFEFGADENNDEQLLIQSWRINSDYPLDSLLQTRNGKKILSDGELIGISLSEVESEFIASEEENLIQITYIFSKGR